MSNLFGSQPKVIPEFTGLQVNTSVQVLPVPIIYGSPRVSINLIYYNGFNVQFVDAGGGKGILSGGKGAQQVEYFATVIMGIGEGPLSDIQIIYQDQNVWTFNTFPSNGLLYIEGHDGTPPLPYIVARWPQDARPYKATAYVAFTNAQLDASATVPQIGFVLHGIYQGTTPLNNSTITVTTGQYNPDGTPMSFIGNISLGLADADPARVIVDFLANPQYGATFPPEFINNNSIFSSANAYDPNIGDQALSTFCQAVGLAWSVVVNNVESANSIIDRWCKNLGVAPIWDGALLSFIPYWDKFSGDNPGWDPAGTDQPKKYFNPYVIPICDIPYDQILETTSKDEDPITFMRKDPMEVYNTVRISFKDRTNFFNDVPVEQKDEAHVNNYGIRIDNIGTADEFSLQAYANTSALLQLRRNISISREFTWRMGPLWGWISPMNIFNIPNPSLDGSLVLVRIISVDDDDEENITVTAEEFPVGSMSPTIIPTSPTTPPNQGPTNVPPSLVYTPVIFAPTTAMLTAQGFSVPQVVLGTSGGNNNQFAGTLDPNWGGAFIWVSLDNVTYQKLGTLTGPSTIGVLTQSLQAYGGANPDLVDTLMINLNESDGVLASFDTSAAAAGASIAVIQDSSGFEVLSYTTATLVAPFTYALTGLYRGLYGTTPRLFSAGSEFLFLGSNSNFFETALPPQYVGKTFFVKLQSFNVFNTASQDLSTLFAYQYIATSPTPVPPAPPTSMQSARTRRQGSGKSFETPKRRRKTP